MSHARRLAVALGLLSVVLLLTTALLPPTTIDDSSHGLSSAVIAYCRTHYANFVPKTD